MLTGRRLVEHEVDVGTRGPGGKAVAVVAAQGERDHTLGSFHLGLHRHGDDQFGRRQGHGRGAPLHLLDVFRLLRAATRERHGQVLPDVHVRRAGVEAGRARQFILAEHGKGLFKGDLGLQPGKWCSQAAVDTLTEADVAHSPG